MTKPNLENNSDYDTLAKFAATEGTAIPVIMTDSLAAEVSLAADGVILAITKNEGFGKAQKKTLIKVRPGGGLAISKESTTELAEGLTQAQLAEHLRAQVRNIAEQAARQIQQASNQ